MQERTQVMPNSSCAPAVSVGGQRYYWQPRGRRVGQGLVKSTSLLDVRETGMSSLLLKASVLWILCILNLCLISAYGWIFFVNIIRSQCIYGRVFLIVVNTCFTSACSKTPREFSVSEER